MANIQAVSTGAVSFSWQTVRNADALMQALYIARAQGNADLAEQARANVATAAIGLTSTVEALCVYIQHFTRRGEALEAAIFCAALALELGLEPDAPAIAAAQALLDAARR